MKTDNQLANEIAPLMIDIVKKSNCKACVIILLEDSKSGLILTGEKPDSGADFVYGVADKIQDALGLEEMPLRNFNVN